MGGQWSVTMRPETIDDLYGLDNIKKSVKVWVKDDTWPNAIGLAGIFGGCKTTTAKILASMMACKSPKSNGDSCGVCPSCIAIKEEHFNRDVIMINGGDSSKGDIVDRLSEFTATPPTKDKRKVCILEEVQELSDAARNSLLKILETKRKNIHFILLSMDLKFGATAKQDTRGLVSRCQFFPFKFASVEQILYYLKYIMEKTGDWKDSTIPSGFKTKGLLLLAQNSEGSYRQAIQLLQRCIDTKTFELKQIEEDFGIQNVEGFYEAMIDLASGKPTEKLFNATLSDGFYEEHFNLMYKVVGDCETYRIFGNVQNKEEWTLKQAKSLLAQPYYPIMRDAIKNLRYGSYMKKADFVLMVITTIPYMIPIPHFI